MHVSFNPLGIYNTNFKGSFKIEDLDALICDFDIEEEVEKPAINENEKILNTKTIAKNFNVTSLGQTTKVKMWSAPAYKIEQSLPSTQRKFCKDQFVYPAIDIFAIQGLSEDNKRYVMFNTFFADETSGVNCAQVFYLESEDENYTQLQKNVFKFMRDSLNKRYFTNTTRNNPFAKFSNGAQGNSDFVPTINALAEISRTAHENDMIDENNDYRAIIYTADGKYDRYKHYTKFLTPSET